MTKRGKFILIEGISGSGKTTLAREYLIPFLEETGIEVQSNTEPSKNNAFGRTIRSVIEGWELSSEEIRDLRKAVAFLDVALGLSTFLARVERGEKAKEFLRSLDQICAKLENGKTLTELERQLLFLADRCFDLHETIMPALSAGKWVVQDRYDLSNFAYGSAHGASMEELYEWHRVILGKDYLVPDMTFFISIPPEVAVQRLKNSGKPIDLHEGLESLKKVDEQYTRAIAFRQIKSVEENEKDSTRPLAMILVISGMAGKTELKPPAVFKQMKNTLDSWLKK